MNRHVVLVVVAVLIAVIAGCATTDPKLTTHAYKLENLETEAALIHSVLNDLWRTKSIHSRSKTNSEGFAVVRTTSEGHTRIERLLAEVRRQESGDP